MKVKVFWIEVREKTVYLSKEAVKDLVDYKETLKIMDECGIADLDIAWVENMAGQKIAGDSLQDFLR